MDGFTLMIAVVLYDGEGVDQVHVFFVWLWVVGWQAEGVVVEELGWIFDLGGDELVVGVDELESLKVYW